MPLAVHLADRAIVRGGRAAMVLLVGLWAVTAAWITGWRGPFTGMTPPSGVISLNPGGILEDVTRNVYLMVFVAALVVAAASRSVRSSVEGRSGHGTDGIDER